MKRSGTNPKDLQPISRKSKKLKIAGLGVVLFLLIGGGWFLRAGLPWLHGVQAYIYGFPLVIMDLTRESMTAVDKPGEIKAPVNHFAVMTHLPDTSFRDIPRTGLDTLFATSWADLKAEPLVLSVPDSAGRYYAIALFDYWSNVFASIGSRTTGTEAGSYLIVGPGWDGVVPPEIKQVYESPTRWVWVNAQMRSDGSKEEELVSQLQKKYLLTPLGRWGKDYEPAADTAELSKEAVSDITPPEKIRKMDVQAFYGRLAKLMGENPPTSADAPMVSKLKSLGILPGKQFDISNIDSRISKALQRSMSAFRLLQIGVQKLETNEGWIVIPENFANYGTDYLTRAGIALIGLGGIWPSDILYPTAFLDVDDKEFDAAKRYVLHFDKGQLPPAKEMWSVSMYDPQGFYVPNTIDRYNLAGWNKLRYNSDGSLDIYIQSESPGIDKETNWLPTPPSGTFNMVTRIFWPDKKALDGTWKMPGVHPLP